MRRFLPSESSGTDSARRAFLQGTSWIGSEPIGRFDLTSRLPGLKAEGGIAKRWGREEKAPPADGNAWDEARSEGSTPPLRLTTSVHTGSRPQAFACGSYRMHSQE